MAPVIGGACNFKSKENRLENFPLKSSLKENVKHMYSTVGNLVHVWMKIVLFIAADMIHCSIPAAQPHFYKPTVFWAEIFGLQLFHLRSIIEATQKKQGQNKTGYSTMSINMSIKCSIQRMWDHPSKNKKLQNEMTTSHNKYVIYGVVDFDHVPDPS